MAGSATLTVTESATVPVFQGEGRIGFHQKPVPQPGAGQLLLQCRANALCGSERHQFCDGTPVTPGHETAGVVVAAGPQTKTPLGTPGVVFLMDFCGACRSCKQGFTNQCLAKRGDMGFSRDGGYGVYELVHENIFFPIDSELSFADATLLLDIMGTGGHALRRAKLVHPDIQSVLVCGAGPIGLGVLAMCRLMLGSEVHVYISDVSDYRLKLAEGLGGKPLNVAEQTLPEALRRHGRSKVDLAIDTSGRNAARQAAMLALEQRGVLVNVGHGEGLNLDVSRDLIAPERAVLGSEYFCFSELSENKKLLREHRSYLSQIITHTFPVSDIQAAFELFFSGKTGKVVIEQ